MTHRLLYGEGDQTVRLVPIDALGRPTRVATATYTIVDLTETRTSADRVVTASTAATLDAVSTTLSAAAGRQAANPHVLPVSSVSDIVEGRQYLLSTADGGGHRELVTAERVATTDVHSLRPLLGVYESADTLEGIELSATFPASVADDEDLAIRDWNQYQITWSYEIDGRPYLVPQLITVERYSTVPWIQAKAALRGASDLARRLQPTDIQDALVAATEEIEGELEAAGVRPEYYRQTTAGRIAARYLVLHHLYRNAGGDNDREESETFRNRFKNQIHKIINSKVKDAQLVSRHNDTASGFSVAGILVPT